MRTIPGLWLLAALAACSSSGSTASSTTPAGESGGAHDAAPDVSGDDGGSVVPMGGGGPDCAGGCCPMPQAASSCSTSDEGHTCQTSTTCAGGLIVPQTLTCTTGTWQAHGDCNPDGGVASNGCPQSQPTSGDACSLPSGTSCQYALVCPGTCDAATSPPDGSAGQGCVSIAGKVGPAICSSGHWQTTPLGSCP